MISSSQLIQALTDARNRTLGLVGDLTDEQLVGPSMDIVNPLLWEVGHVAWFQEKWVLRHSRQEDPVRPDVDALYNSADVAHDTRWSLPLPSRRETLGYMQEVLNRIIDRLGSGQPTPEQGYFHLLALFHEDMHAEAFTYTRQTLGYSPPALQLSPIDPAFPHTAGPFPGDTEVPATTFYLGATKDFPFVFDNEKWAHAIEANSFRIARAAVTNADFAAFVEDGGYLRKEWWSESGWDWRQQAGAEHPVYWSAQPSNRWLIRRFDEFVSLKAHLPVIHINWYEAEAFCAWAGRRLPTEAEWEMAASMEPTQESSSDERAPGSKRWFPWGKELPGPDRSNLDGRVLGCVDVGSLPAGDSAVGCRQMIGNVWEWTANSFLPYPGFVVDPYREYSQPWFKTHKVLRGGCWATRSRLIRNTWRNFYTPDRRDVWAGFRTCSLEP